MKNTITVQHEAVFNRRRRGESITVFCRACHPPMGNMISASLDLPRYSSNAALDRFEQVLQNAIEPKLEAAHV